MVANIGKYEMPTGEHAIGFLRASSDDYLCARNDFGQTALHLAVREENVDVVGVYVERRVPCVSAGNKDGDTPLHYAAYWGKSECTRLLLGGGASPEAKNDKGQTPLDDAREVGREDIAALLLSKVQEVDSRNEL